MTNELVEISDSILNIKEPFSYDESIKSLDFSEIILQSQDNINKVSSQIVFNINNQNTIYYPAKSYLEFKGKIVKNNDTLYAEDNDITLVNNAMMFLFSSISYKIGSTIIETISNPGQATSMIGYLSLPDDYSTSSGLKNCWSKDTTDNASSIEFVRSEALAGNDAIVLGKFTPRRATTYNQGFALRKSFIFSSNPIGSFTFTIPLSHIFGFAEYNRILYGVKHTLTLVRDSDNQALFRNNAIDAGKVVLENIAWHIPEVELNPLYNAAIMKMIDDKENFPVSFMARTCENTAVPQARTFDWRLQVTGGVEKPRWIIFGFQIDRLDDQTKNTAVFDNLNLTNAFVKLNSVRYPKDDFSINFPKNDYARLYERFDDFKKEFYGIDSLIGGTQVNYSAYRHLFPIIVFDLRRQDEQFRTAVVDLQAKFMFNENVPANTSAYAILLSDRLYNLSSNGNVLSLVSY